MFSYSQKGKNFLNIKETEDIKEVLDRFNYVKT